MIKEYVENLPGGKEYIAAQNSINRCIGAAVGIFLSAVLLAIMMPEVSIEMFFFGPIILIVVFGAVGIIMYYYYINKADNIYAQSGLKNFIDIENQRFNRLKSKQIN